MVPCSLRGKAGSAAVPGGVCGPGTFRSRKTDTV